MLYGTDRVINHFADKSFAEQVEALQEECLKRSDPVILDIVRIVWNGMI